MVRRDRIGKHNPRRFFVYPLLLVIGVVVSCENPLQDIIEEDVQPDIYELTITDDGHGTTTPAGIINVTHGVPKEISAIPNNLYEFIQWSVASGSGVSFHDAQSADTSVTLTGGNAKIKAEFRATGIAVTSPNGGELLVRGKEYEITWIAPEYTGTVKIELLQGDTINSTISASTNNDGTFSWTVPAEQTEGADYKIRIATLGGTSYTDDSNGVFTVGTMNITSPNGGEVYAVGGTEEITWDSNYAGNVKIDLLKNGAFDQTIVESTPNDGSYTWEDIAVAGSSKYTIEITILSTLAEDVSDVAFSIIDHIELTSFTDGDVVEPGSSVDIEWLSTFSGNVKIELFKADTKISDITESTENDGSYTWAIPTGLDLAGDYSLKLSTTTVPALSGESGSTFIVEKFELTEPLGGELWKARTKERVLWNSSGQGNVTIELFKGGFLDSTITSSTPNDGRFDWDIPHDQIPRTDYRIKILSTNNRTVAAETSGDIMIDNIIVTNPNGNGNLKTGYDVTIEWESLGYGDVTIELYKGGTLDSSIVSSTANTGTYDWIVPADQTGGADYRVNITSISDPLMTDMSNEDFGIQDLILLQPNGGEYGSKGDIHWESALGGDVRIDLYKGGEYYTTMYERTPNDGFALMYDYPTPPEPDPDYRVKITTLSTPVFSDMSDNDFTIEIITITRPCGPDNIFIAGTTEEITWDSSRQGTVSICLDSNCSTPIVADTPNDGVYEWDVPIDFAENLPNERRMYILWNNTLDWGQSEYTNSGFSVCSKRWIDLGTVGISKDVIFDELCTGIAVDPSDSKPIVVFAEGDEGDRARVKKWSEGTNWTEMGYAGNELGYGRPHVEIVIDPSDNKPIVLCREYDGEKSSYRAHAMKWSSGYTWTDLGFADQAGANDLSLCIDPTDNKPIVCYLDDRPRAAKWSNGTEWTDLGTVSSETCEQIDCAVDNNGKPVVVYQESSSRYGYVKRWASGTSWDDLGFPQTVIYDNYNFGLSIAVDRSDNQPIVIYNSYDDNTIQVKKLSSGSNSTNLGIVWPSYLGFPEIVVRSDGKPFVSSNRTVLKWISGTTWEYLGLPFQCRQLSIALVDPQDPTNDDVYIVGVMWEENTVRVMKSVDP